MMTPEAKHLHARQTNRDLQTAEARLCNALATTGDDTVARSIDQARKALKPALRRAEAIVKDIDLKAAEQTALDIDGGQPTRGIL